MSAALAFFAIKGAGALTAHDAKNRKNAEYNVWKQKRDLATKKGLRIQYGNARQGITDIDRSKIRDADITAEQQVVNRLAELRNVASIKAVGGPEGQSTEQLKAQSIGDILREENAFMQDMEVKNTQYAMQEREIKFGMDMAFLNAQASIDSTRYQRGDGGLGLFMDIAGAGAQAYAMA
jgi:hypothetical protein